MAGIPIRDVGDLDAVPTLDGVNAASMIPVAPAVAAPAVAAAPAQQSTNPSAPGYVNPQSPYYVSPTARGAIPLGNSAPRAAAPPPPADPNKFAQQSTDPAAPYYVNPQSPYFNPRAPKPVAVDAFPNGPVPDAEPGAPAIGPATPIVAGNKYAGASGAGAGATTAPSINWGGAAGGAAVVPAHEQKLTTKAREDELLGGIDKEAAAIEEQKTAVGNSADANAEIKNQEAQGLRQIADASNKAGAGVTARAKQHADESKAYRAHLDNYAAKLATDKIDPQRMWNSASTGTQITWTLAKAFGAIGQAFLHTPTNQIADHIEEMAAKDVAAQRANHEIGRERLNDMKTMYGEALRETGNAEDAERVATGYALEAAKQQAQALTVSAQGKAQKAKGDEVVAQLTERQALLGQKKAETGIKLNPMVQDHATGGADAKLGDKVRKYIEENAQRGTVVTPDEARRFVIATDTGRDPLPGAGPFATGAKEAAGEKKDRQHGIDEANKQYEDILKHPAIDKFGFLPSVADAGNFQRLMPGSTALRSQATKINLMMDSAATGLLKDKDGRIPPDLVEQMAKFHVKVGDTPEFAREQIRASQEYANSLARQANLRADAPNQAPPQGFKP